MKYSVFSKGLHSTWLLNYEYSTLFDCGEGCATFLGYDVFVPNYIFLSHDHIDHIAGLPSFIGLRNATKGANDKPLTIFYPEHNKKIEDWLHFSIKQAGRLKYSLQIRPLKPLERVRLPSNEERYVEAFPVQHAFHPCYGYRIISISKRLKPEFQNKTKEFYSKLTPEQKANITEPYLHNKFLFSGDAMPIPHGPNSPLNNAEVAFLDGTFLSENDRENPTHATLEELAIACSKAKVLEAYAIHISIRYSKKEVQQKLNELAHIFPLKTIPNYFMASI